MPAVYEIESSPSELTQINKIALGEQMEKRQGTASSAETEKRGGVTDRERIIKDKDGIDKYFKEKSETLQNIINLK